MRWFFVIFYLNTVFYFACDSSKESTEIEKKFTIENFNIDTLTISYGDNIPAFRFKNIVKLDDKIYILTERPDLLHVVQMTDELNGHLQLIHEFEEDGPGSVQYADYLSSIDDSLLLINIFNKIVIIDQELNLVKEFFVDVKGDDQRNPFSVLQQDSLSIATYGFFRGYNFNKQSSASYILSGTPPFMDIVNNKYSDNDNSTYFFDLNLNTYESDIISSDWNSLFYGYQTQIFQTSSIIAQVGFKPLYFKMKDNSTLFYGINRSANFYAYDLKRDSVKFIEVLADAAGISTHPLLEDLELDYVDDENEHYKSSHYNVLMPFFHSVYYDEATGFLFRPYSLSRKNYEEEIRMHMMVFDKELEKIGDFPLYAMEKNELIPKVFDWADETGLYFRIDPETYEDQLRFIRYSIN